MRQTLLSQIVLCVTLTAPSFTAAETVPETSAAWVADIRAPQYFAVFVADAEVSAAWYRKVFGLRELDRSQAPDGTWQIINLTGPALLVEIIRDNRQPAESRGRGFAKVGFSVVDVEVAAAAIGRAAGSTPRVIDIPQHGLRIVQMRDPDDNIIQLSSPLKSR